MSITGHPSPGCNFGPDFDRLGIAQTALVPKPITSHPKFSVTPLIPSPGALDMKSFLAALLFAFATVVYGAEPDKDSRSRIKTLNDTDYFFQVPETKEAWTKRSGSLRVQILAAAGLWPMPAKSPIKFTVTAKIDRDAYTIQNVWFESRPGQIVTGSLFVPKDIQKLSSAQNGKIPGVLCPHGHWANGRFYETPAQEIPKEIKIGAEERPDGAKYPVQALCHQLAKLGCVVFLYDMVGYADNRPINHREGFTDAQAELWSMNWFGLQTYNSVRALDFLLSMPEVDSTRIGVTGSSGGGTQTFILGAIDDRPTANFSAVMVGTRMQGGCVCENASWLRVGTGNVEIAGMFAPKPMGLTGANDWTIAIEKEGYPDLQKLYGMYDKTDMVKAKCWPEFGHNFNQVARDFLYNWFNKHLSLGHQGPIKESAFVPVPPAQLANFPKGTEIPEGILGTRALRATLIQEAQVSLAPMRKNFSLGDSKPLEAFLDPIMEMAVGKSPKEKVMAKAAEDVITLTRPGTGEFVRLKALNKKAMDAKGPITLVAVSGQEYDAFLKGKVPQAAENSKPNRVFIIEPFGTSVDTQKRTKIGQAFAGYYWGYNRPIVAERARDIQTALAWASQMGTKATLVGIGSGAVPISLALAASPGLCERADLDLQGFRFEDLRALEDERFLPGAMRWGGMGALLARGLPKGSEVRGFADLWTNP